MRTVLENMNDGIVLIDKDFNWKFGNDQFNRFLDVPPEITQPGTSCYDVIRYQAERGDFGPTDDVEKVVQRARRHDAHARRLPLRAADARAAATSSSPTSRSPTAACSASTATSPN